MLPRRHHPIGVETLQGLLAWPATARTPSPLDAFETAWAERLCQGHTIATASGRDGLTLILDALGLEPGDELIVPGYTLGELIPLLQARGLVLRPADIDPGTFNPVPGTIQRCLTPRTRAVLVVHLFGAPCDIAAIRQVCNTSGTALIEDCAHATGAVVDGQPVGTFGDAALFSLEPNKPVPAYGGGMVTTHDDALAVRIRAAIATRKPGEWSAARRVATTCIEEGLVRSPLYGLAARVLFHPDVAPHFERAYRNSSTSKHRAPRRFSDLQARVGLAHLKRLENRNRTLNTLWEQLASDLPARLVAQRRDAVGTPAFYNFVARFDGDPVALRQAALRRGIDLAIGSEVMDDIGVQLGTDTCPVAAEVARSAVMIPLHAGIGPRSYRKLVDGMNKACDDVA